MAPRRRRDLSAWYVRHMRVETDSTVVNCDQGLCGSLIGNPQYDWSFSSVPQKHVNDRTIFQPRSVVAPEGALLREIILTVNLAEGRLWEALLW